MPVAPPANSSLHRDLLSLGRRTILASEEALASRHEKWRRSERTYRLYVDPTEVQGPDSIVNDEANMLYTNPASIVVPLSYALTQTLISFWVNLFTTSKPYFNIDPADMNSHGPARAQELLLTYQLERQGWVALLYQWLLDTTRYGVGIASIGWDTQYRLQTVKRTLTMPTMMGPQAFPISEKRQVLEYEGNALDIVDPFVWRPDHRWPVAKFQRGNFCGELLWRSYFDLKQREAQGYYANVSEIPRYTQEHMRENSSDRDRIMQAHSRYGFSMNDPDNALVMVEQMVIDLIPSKYGLGGDQVERWVLTLANRAVVVRVDPYEYDHHDFPYAVMESSLDMHSLTNPSLLEIMEPVHQHITWFFNSMQENARKSLNDRLIVDPSMLNMDDFYAPDAGKTIRLAREYWGTPNAAKAAVHQLQVQDISSKNMDHVGMLTDLLHKISAASETMQGQVTQEERTATEISSVAQQGAARLRTQARLFSTTGLVPLARQMVQNNQQFLSQATYLKIIGNMDQAWQGSGQLVDNGFGVQISPEDIQGMFQFPVSDASMPLDPVRFARTWVQIMQMSMQNEILYQRVNHLAVWGETLKSMGIPDPSKFLIPMPDMQVVPDQMLDQQLQAGNVIPIRGGPGSAPPPRSPMPARQEAQSIQGEENRVAR